MNQNHKISPLNPPTIQVEDVSVAWRELYGSANALAIAAAASRHSGLAVAVTGSSREAEMLVESLKFYSSESVPILFFPCWECLPYDTFSPHQDIVSQRINLLSKLPLLARGIVVVSVDNLMQRLPPVNYIAANSFALATGSTLNIEVLRDQLNQASYRDVKQVEVSGEYAFRGGVIDLYPTGAADPIRIELFGDRIDTLRFFDAQTQLSKQKIESIEILPGGEIPINDESIRSLRQGIREHLDGDPRENEVYNEIDSKQLPNGAEFYLPLFYRSTSLLFDYVPSSSVYFTMESCQSGADQFWQQVNERFQLASDRVSRLPLLPNMLFLSPTQLGEQLKFHANVQINGMSHSCIHNFRTKQPLEISAKSRNVKLELMLQNHLKSARLKTLICVDGLGQRETVENALKNIEIPYARVETWDDFIKCNSQLAISVSRLQAGLQIPQDGLQVITSSELFGRRIQAPKPTTRVRSPEALIASMEELEIGEPVVHELYGIGLYRGLVTMDVTGSPAEFLTIEYRDNETLYVPVYSIDYVSRFVGSKSEELVLNSLSSKNWDKARRKARKKVFDIAAELLEIQSLRDSRKGNCMPVPEEDYQNFVSRFTYRETPDQKDAIGHVLNDLSLSRPMDRLICGDVGFGKTEVAMRAALVAVANNYQVAVVVPTTLLAQQHFDVFQDRFSEMGIRIELLSRMRKGSDVKDVMHHLKTGKVDIAIGTHRLLQSDVEFSNLGLLIIDEEHRFGVRQKEHLKKLRTNVDILTLTATPIPRTLSMAMNEIRDISIIATPPDNRLSVRTFLKSWQPEIIREACQRELGRGGQIFYVYNEVRSIQQAARELAKIVPEATINVAHGQMPKLKLEAVMKNFYMQKFDVLVCSTIIESGIDIPTANTIIIDRASKLGLAQLHQLRGRVGRSHHQAYAYLLIPNKEYLRGEARRRLEAIEAFDQLGMGYVIAAHDLEIRGAGALLGEEQSGAINDIGYAMYSDFLQDAVLTLKRSHSKQIFDSSPVAKQDSAEINLHAPALIPEKWIPNVNLRLTLYRKIATARDNAKLNQLKAEMLDRFGRFPKEVSLLFHISSLKLHSKILGIVNISIGSHSGRIVFGAQANFDVSGLNHLIESYPGSVKLSKPDSAILLTHSLDSEDDRIKKAFFILDTITPKGVNSTQQLATN